MRIFTLPSGQETGIDSQFQIKDQVYPAGWLRTASDDELKSAGITVSEVEDPPPPPPPPPSTVVEGLTFLKRLTLEEYGAVSRAAVFALIADPSRPELMRWLDMVRVNSAVDVAGEDAQMAKKFLVGANLLSAERAEEIFSV